MGERYSVVGVLPDGRRTTLLAHTTNDEAVLVAMGMEQGCPEFVRIDIVAETLSAKAAATDANERANNRVPS